MVKFTVLVMTMAGMSLSIAAQQFKPEKSELLIPEKNIIRTVVDIDGNIYKTIDIGYHTWMMENLKTTRYRDGSPISLIEDNNKWINSTSGAYCWYNNDTSNKHTYGALYNRYAVTNDLCPEGWKIPNFNEFRFVGDDSNAGKKMKEAGTAHWESPNLATNSSGFTALPGGVRSNTDGSFQQIGKLGSWWTAITNVPNFSFFYSLRNNSDDIQEGRTYYKEHGLSVRCIKEYAEPAIELERGLIAYYPFDGNANDESGNGHHGTNNGTTPITDRFGIPNKAFAFSGAENSLSFQNFQLPVPYSTITGWIMITDENADTILATTTPQKLRILLRVVDQKYQLELFIKENKVVLTNEYALTSLFRKKPGFDFLAIAFSGKYVYFIINKALIAMVPLNEDEAGYQFPFTVMRDPAYVFNGVLDDVRIYNRGLTFDEIAALSDDRLIFPPKIINDSVVSVGRNVVQMQSEISDDGGDYITESGYCWSINPLPDTSDTKSESGKISGLNPNTTYYIRAYAQNRLHLSYGRELSFTTLPDFNYGSVGDIDGNSYKTIKIGTQNWMAENLKTTKYADGTPIGNGNIQNDEYGKFYFSYNTDTSYNKTYGLYYTWMAATNSKYGRTYSNGIQGACPDGWHIPNYAEQKALVNFLGGSQVAGGKLKESGFEYWNEPNTGATNESGFTALGSGVRRNNYSSGEFGYTGDFTAFWGSESNYYETFEGKFYSSVVLSLNHESRSGGVSGLLSTWASPVRCLKDTALSYIEIPEILTLPVFDISGTTATTGGKVTNDGGVFGIKIKGICWSKSPNPDTSSFRTMDTSYFNPFLNTITELEPNTKYYARAYVVNPAGVGYGNEFSFVTAPDPLKGTVSDIEGNIYKTITIGSQIWMAENLRTTQFNDGNPISLITNYDDWGMGSGAAAMGWYKNNLKNYTYGALYNWKVVDSEKICPLGWHVPSLTDWVQLENYLGGSEIAGGKLKFAGTDFWIDPNTGGTNVSGFSALPGGFRQGLNGDNRLGENAKIWTSTDENITNLEYSDSKLTKIKVIGNYGGSIRCIKDTVISETFTGKAGDIDYNNQIQSTDASLALQYSVGLDPIPSVDPRPWELARMAAADVDKQNGITAYDASLILQYEAGLIKSFPVEDNKKSLSSPQADINIGLENGFVTFRPSGKLYGFNLHITGSADMLGLPLVLNPNVISATHLTSGSYSVGLATAVAPEENVVVMKIPVTKIFYGQVTVDMKINNLTKHYILGSPTAIQTSTLQMVEIFPNPANTVLYFRNLSEMAFVSIYNLEGKEILKKHVENGQVDISSLKGGTYFIRIKDKNSAIMKKIVKLN